MRDIHDISSEEAHSIGYVLTDIDDTLTKDGRLLKGSYSALWDLRDSGISVIPVTGRPAGWCDMIIREWPVDAVVGENGAFVYYWDSGRIATFYHPEADRDSLPKRFDALKRAVFSEVPDARIARDQFCRIFDLAIDFNEDPPHLGFEAAEKIRAVCERFGAHAKVSSIHVNTWFGDYDKRATATLFLSERYDLSIEEQKGHVLFCGDSPNDEPMFEFFPLSVAVANISVFSSMLKHLPTFITRAAYGFGFEEMTATILYARRG
ncbi:MAG TPA: HAD-IIB family hydrolase [Spirochaetia bacterium]|nr:HAD-IIB family hydrolase [Spirochaetia bacterium]